MAGLYSEEKQQTRSVQKNSPSLSTIVMSLESNTAKQQALQHILNAMHIQQLRQCIVRALSSHTNLKNSNKVSLYNFYIKKILIHALLDINHFATVYDKTHYNYQLYNGMLL